MIMKLRLFALVCYAATLQTSVQLNLCEHQHHSILHNSTTSATKTWTLEARNCYFDDVTLLLKFTKLKLFSKGSCLGKLNVPEYSASKDFCNSPVNSCILFTSNRSSCTDGTITKGCGKVFWVIKTVAVPVTVKYKTGPAYYGRLQTFEISIQFISSGPTTTPPDTEGNSSSPSTYSVFSQPSQTTTESKIKKNQTTTLSNTKYLETTTVTNVENSRTSIVTDAKISKVPRTSEIGTASTVEAQCGPTGGRNVSSDLAIIFGALFAAMTVVLLILGYKYWKLYHQLHSRSSRKGDTPKKAQENEYRNLEADATYSVVKENGDTEIADSKREIVVNELYNMQC